MDPYRELYRKKWSADYASLADAVLVAADGTRIEVHACVLKSPLVTGLVASMKGTERPAIHVTASPTTIHSILSIAYDNNYQPACYQPPIRELLELLNYLGCEYLLEQVLDKFSAFVNAFTSRWCQGFDESESFNELPDSFYSFGDDTCAEHTRFVELCVALLTYTRTYHYYVREVVGCLRNIRAKQDTHWTTIMSHPLWDGVSGSVLTKFLLAVTNKQGSLIFPVLEPVSRCASVTIPGLAKGEGDGQPFVKIFQLDGHWVVKCRYSEYRKGKYSNSEVWVENSSDRNEDCSKIKAEMIPERHIDDMDTPFQNVVVVCSNPQAVDPNDSNTHRSSFFFRCFDPTCTIRVNATITDYLVGI